MAFFNYGISADYTTDLARKIQVDTQADVSELTDRVTVLEGLLTEKSNELTVLTQKMAAVIALFESITEMTALPD
jgi:vacuolar-type H+-ATPase subunit I/STV1